MIYTVTINQSIAGPRVIGWRKLHQRTQRDIRWIPYKLAVYLCLVPRQDWLGFTNRLYQFSNSDLKSLETDEITIKVTDVGIGKKVTIDTSKFIESPNLLGEK